MFVDIEWPSWVILGIGICVLTTCYWLDRRRSKRQVVELQKFPTPGALICTHATRPPARFPMRPGYIYETDTGNTYFYDGYEYTWVDPAPIYRKREK